MSFTVYHWTSKESADTLVRTQKPRRHFWVCKNKEDWHGEVCLVVEMPTEADWDNPDKASWQRCLHNGLPDGAQIRFLEEKP